jgi:hypothetical protein
MELGDLPPQLRPVFQALAAVMRSREPAIRQRVDRLRLENPGLDDTQLARRLIRDTRLRVTTTAAASGAAAIVPGIGTVISIGTATSQSLYALEQETELVLAIAIIYGRELADSDQRLLEALVVVGLTGGAVKLRDNLLIAGGQNVTIAAFRRLPSVWLGRAGSRVLARVLGRVLAERAVSVVARTVPLAIGLAAGASFDFFAVTLLGRAAMRYYGRTGTELPLGAPGRTIELPPRPAAELMEPAEGQDSDQLEAGGGRGAG